MTYLGHTDYLIQVAKGLVPGSSIVHKFGRNTAVGTTFVPVALGGVYQTPQSGSATTLRVKAGDAGDDSGSTTGAREVTLIGVNQAGAEVTESVATNGTSASSATAATFMRLYRAYVSESGVYASSTAGAHAADIVIENGAGGTDWATISATGFARSQTEIGAYTVPTGYTAYVLRASVFADSTKTTETVMFQRESILDTAAPYEAMRVLADLSQEGGETDLPLRSPIKINGETDVGFMSKVNTSTAEVDVEFEILLVQD